MGGNFVDPFHAVIVRHEQSQRLHVLCYLRYCVVIINTGYIKKTSLPEIRLFYSKIINTSKV